MLSNRETRLQPRGTSVVEVAAAHHQIQKHEGVELCFQVESKPSSAANRFLREAERLLLLQSAGKYDLHTGTAILFKKRLCDAFYVGSAHPFAKGLYLCGGDGKHRKTCERLVESRGADLPHG